MTDCCRICLEDQSEGHFICPCQCKGSMQYVHAHCLEQWRRSSTNPHSFYQCDQCCYHYSFTRTMISTILQHTYIKCILTVMCFLLLSLMSGSILYLCSTIPTQSVFYTLLYSIGMGSIMIGAIGISTILVANVCVLHGTNLTLSSQHLITKLYIVLLLLLGICHALYRIYQLITYITDDYASSTENIISVEQS